MEGSIDLEEAMAALDRLSLTVLSLDQYLVILNTKVDATLDGEPYLSLMLFFDTKSSNFLARIWNRTVASGQVLDIDHLIQLCKNHFNQGRPCVGYLKYGWLGKNMLTNDSAPACHLFLTNNYPKEVIMCPVCDDIFRGEGEQISSDLQEEFESSNRKCSDNLVEVISKGEKASSVSVGAGGFDKNEVKSADHESSPVVDPRTLQADLSICDDNRTHTETSSAEANFSLLQLIKEVLTEYEMLSLDEINEAISRKYRSYKKAEPRGDLRGRGGLKSSIRQNLSLLPCFERVPGKSGKKDRNYLWKLRPIQDSVEVASSVETITSDAFNDDNEPCTDYYLGSQRVENVSGKLEEDNESELRVDTVTDEHEEVPLKICHSCKEEIHIDAVEEHSVKCSKMTNYEQSGVSKESSSSAIFKSDSFEEGSKIPQKCPWCDRVFLYGRLTTFKDHIRQMHFWGMFPCTLCPFRAEFAKDLVEHHKLVGHKEDILIKCPSCHKAISKNEIEHHYEGCISLKFKNRNKKMGIYARHARKNHVPCQTCGKVINTKRAYQRHVLGHLRDSGATEEEIKKVIPNAGKLYRYCDQCGKKFTTLHYLRKHIDSEHEGKVLKCDTCQETFATYNLLIGHKNKIHSTDEKYICKHCGERCRSVTRRRHHERKHEEPQFQCSFCPKRLKSEKNLIAHERYHTGERPFPCSLCGAAFTDHGRLVAHQKGAHKIARRGGQIGWANKKKKSLDNG